MGLNRTISLAGIVAALAGTALAGEATKVAYNTTQDSVDQRVKKELKKPDAQLYGLIGEWQKVEGLDGKWQEVLDLYRQRTATVRDYNLDFLPVNDRKHLGIIMNDFGISLYSLGKLEESLPYLNLAVDLNPTDQIPLRNLALVHKELGKTHNDKNNLVKAISLYEATIRLNPSSDLAVESKNMISIIQSKYLPAL